MSNEITVRIETSYGRRLVYPVCKQAMLLCKLTGYKKTLTDEAIAIIKEMGFTIKIEAQTL